MRRRLRQLAGGRFDFTLPNVSFSADKIDIQVKEGTDHQDEFEGNRVFIESENGMSDATV